MKGGGFISNMYKVSPNIYYLMKLDYPSFYLGESKPIMTSVSTRGMAKYRLSHEARLASFHLDGSNPIVTFVSAIGKLARKKKERRV